MRTADDIAVETRLEVLMRLSFVGVTARYAEYSSDPGDFSRFKASGPAAHTFQVLAGFALF